MGNKTKKLSIIMACFFNRDPLADSSQGFCVFKNPLHSVEKVRDAIAGCLSPNQRKALFYSLVTFLTLGILASLITSGVGAAASLSKWIPFSKPLNAYITSIYKWLPYALGATGAAGTFVFTLFMLAAVFVLKGKKEEEAKSYGIERNNYSRERDTLTYTRNPFQNQGVQAPKRPIQEIDYEEPPLREAPLKKTPRPTPRKLDFAIGDSVFDHRKVKKVEAEDVEDIEKRMEALKNDFFEKKLIFIYVREDRWGDNVYEASYFTKNNKGKIKSQPIIFGLGATPKAVEEDLSLYLGNGYKILYDLNHL